MYKILIAEDEEIEREALVQIIAKAKLPIHRILQCNNGQSAIDLYKQEQPDLLLFDINMPLVSGLEAFREIKKQAKKDVTCLILTSYDYFSYAQEAIKLGVEDFILKPAKPNQIIESVSKALETLQVVNNVQVQSSSLIRRLSDMQPLLEKECMYMILMRQNDIEIQKSFKILNIVMREALCFVMKEEEEENIASFINHMEEMGNRILKGYSNHMIVLYIISNYTIQAEVIQNSILYLKQQGIHPNSIGIGCIVNEIGKLYESYQVACKDYEQKTIKDELLKVNNSTIFIDVWSKRIFKAFGEDDCNQIIQEYVNELLSLPKIEWDQVNQAIVKTFIQMCALNYQLLLDEKDSNMIHIQEDAEPKIISIELIHAFNGLFHPIQMMRYGNVNSIVKKTHEYIQKNYNKPISLNDLAKEFEVTPSYISRLLNQNQGKNFTDIINDYRIKKAKQLIQSHHQLKDIAFEVGFKSQSYFTKIFKKNVGMSPKEYSSLF
ncbi:MAG: response regulator [Erysipelotrichaceae bacterium]